MSLARLQSRGSGLYTRPRRCRPSVNAALRGGGSTASRRISSMASPFLTRPSPVAAVGLRHGMTARIRGPRPMGRIGRLDQASGPDVVATRCSSADAPRLGLGLSTGCHRRVTHAAPDRPGGSGQPSRSGLPFGDAQARCGRDRVRDLRRGARARDHGGPAAGAPMSASRSRRGPASSAPCWRASRSGPGWAAASPTAVDPRRLLGPLLIAGGALTLLVVPMVGRRGGPAPPPRPGGHRAVRRHLLLPAGGRAVRGQPDGGQDPAAGPRADRLGGRAAVGARAPPAPSRARS